MQALSTRTMRHLARGSSKHLPHQDARVPSPLRPIALSCLLACAGVPSAALACDASDTATLKACIDKAGGTDPPSTSRTTSR